MSPQHGFFEALTHWKMKTGGLLKCAAMALKSGLSDVYLQMSSSIWLYVRPVKKIVQGHCAENHLWTTQKGNRSWNGKCLHAEMAVVLLGSNIWLLARLVVPLCILSILRRIEVIGASHIFILHKWPGLRSHRPIKWVNFRSLGYQLSRHLDPTVLNRRKKRSDTKGPFSTARRSSIDWHLSESHSILVAKKISKLVGHFRIIMSMIQNGLPRCEKTETCLVHKWSDWRKLKTFLLEHLFPLKSSVQQFGREPLRWVFLRAKRGDVGCPTENTDGQITSSEASSKHRPR